MSDIRERVERRIAQFKVGDKIAGWLTEADEIEGEIVSIDGQYAQMKTEWGTFKVWLALCHCIETQDALLEHADEPRSPAD